MNRTLVRTDSSDEWGSYQKCGLCVPGLAQLCMLCMPDLMVLSTEAPRAANGIVLGERTLLAVEITSRSNAPYGRTAKLHACADAGVPSYLLVDPWAEKGPQCVAYREPVGHEYLRCTTKPSGEIVELPEPISVKLDTRPFS